VELSKKDPGDQKDIIESIQSGETKRADEAEKVIAVKKSSGSKFNKTNDNIEWAPSDRLP
jgi:hypothetical protein